MLGYFSGTVKWKFKIFDPLNACLTDNIRLLVITLLSELEKVKKINLTKSWLLKMLRVNNRFHLPGLYGKFLNGVHKLSELIPVRTALLGIRDSQFYRALRSATAWEFVAGKM